MVGMGSPGTAAVTPGGNAGAVASATVRSVFVIDPKKEEIAVKEANKLHIPVVAVVDTNCDPDVIDYRIPGNDDAARAIALYTDLIARSIIDGLSTLVTDGTLLKVYAWYDNEMGYACRMVDLACLMREASALVRDRPTGAALFYGRVLSPNG